ncbi:hypothetical protein GLOTRDRAFT_126210 [Gloeophyllum trabeum ATCC 11539]|uniref:Uncharacterized protein n=1 Tax=Gloeophyllum trabeum (strain ATCC 11539 / FP-39264 / Madison 617) TaxID=670483 RepID=S7QEI3_GLOTA|nr:uncharacterized protein GLOTRDRAFT_126210 [Gloeophyllum trabeum ATCC 11539]EPQ57718.1 hypothetical protein GLOTRDRAFT_126210 [Gloeophyllum trabeum ATCC 11539]
MLGDPGASLSTIHFNGTLPEARVSQIFVPHKLHGPKAPLHRPGLPPLTRRNSQRKYPPYARRPGRRPAERAPSGHAILPSRHARRTCTRGHARRYIARGRPYSGVYSTTPAGGLDGGLARKPDGYTRAVTCPSRRAGGTQKSSSYRRGRRRRGVLKGNTRPLATSPYPRRTTPPCVFLGRNRTRRRWREKRDADAWPATPGALTQTTPPAVIESGERATGKMRGRGGGGRDGGTQVHVDGAQAAMEAGGYQINAGGDGRAAEDGVRRRRAGFC